VAMAEDLRRFVEDRPIRARRISPMERLVRGRRRNKALAGSIGLAAGALVAVAILALGPAHRPAEAEPRVARLAHHREKESGALKEERANLRTALSESNRRLAMLDLERGRTAFEKDQVGAGMLWTVESLRMATEAGDPAWKHVALANLSAWRRH